MPPFARDATGSRIPLSYVLKHNALIMRIRRGAAAPTYPILIDPYIAEDQRYWNSSYGTSPYGTPDFNGWQYVSSPAGYFGGTAGNVGNQPSAYGTVYFGNGLTIGTYTGQYPANSIGTWYFIAPGSGAEAAHIFKADFADVYNVPAYSSTFGANSSCDVAQISSQSGVTDPGLVYGGGNPSGSYTNGPYVYCGLDSADYIVECLSSCTSPVSGNPALGTAANQAAFGIDVPSNTNITYNGWVFMGGSLIFESDNYPPHIDTSGVPTGWVAHANVSVAATDYGVGTYSVSASAPGWAGSTAGPPASCYSNSGGNNNGSQGGTPGSPNTGDRNHRCPIATPLPLSFSTDSMPEGSYALGVSSSDVVGNTANASRTINIDRAAPTATVHVPSPASHTATISGNVSDPLGPGANADSGVASLALAITPTGSENWQPICPGTAPNAAGQYSCAWDSTTVQDGQYTIRAVVADGAGNTTTVTTSVTVDSTPPTITDYSGGLNDNEDAAVGRPSTAFTVSAADSTSGVASIELLVDGADSSQKYLWAASSCPAGACSASHQLTVDTSQLASGNHQLSIVVRDFAGNSYTDGWTFVVSPAAPTVTVTGPASANGAILPPYGRSLVMAATEPNSGQPGFGISGATLSIDGSVYQTYDAGCDSGTCDWVASEDLDGANLSDGKHQFALAVTDFAGNTTTKNWTVVVDSTPPTISTSGTLTALGNGPAMLPAYTLHVDAADAGTGVTDIQVLVDNTVQGETSQQCAAGGCSLSYDFIYNTAQYGSGQHLVVVRATDAAGVDEETVLVVNPSAGSLPGPLQSLGCSGAAPTTVTGGTTATPATAKSSLQQYFSAGLADPSSTTDAAGGTVLPALTSQSWGFSATGGEVQTGLAASPAGAVQAGPSSSALCIAPSEEGASAGSLASVGNDAALAPNFLPSTDLVERGTPMGEQSLLQLRDAQAPTSLKWTVNLGSDDSLVAEGPHAVAVVTADSSQPTGSGSGPAPSDGSPTGNADDTTPGGYTPFPALPASQIDPPVAGMAAPPVAGEVASNTLSLAQTPNSAAQLAGELGVFNGAQERTTGTVRGLLWVPATIDATGASVPTTLSISGNIITETLTPGSTVTYPLLIDQEVVAPDASQSAATGGSSGTAGPNLGQSATSASSSGNRSFTSSESGVGCTGNSNAAKLVATTDVVASGNIVCLSNNGTNPIQFEVCIRRSTSRGKYTDYKCVPAPIHVTSSPNGYAARISIRKQCYPGNAIYLTKVRFTLRDNRSVDHRYNYNQDGYAQGDCGQADIWRANAQQGRSSFRNNLLNGGSLPDDHAKSPGLTGWQAHHIVPVLERGASEAQALALRCGVPPNQAVNGVFLRGPSLRAAGELPQKSQHNAPAYKRLDDSDQQRAYHPSLQGYQPYFNYVASNLGPLFNSNGVCTGNWQAAMNGMLTDLLINAAPHR